MNSEQAKQAAVSLTALIHRLELADQLFPTLEIDYNVNDCRMIVRLDNGEIVNVPEGIRESFIFLWELDNGQKFPAEWLQHIDDMEARMIIGQQAH